MLLQLGNIAEGLEASTSAVVLQIHLVLADLIKTRCEYSWL